MVFDSTHTACASHALSAVRADPVVSAARRHIATHVLNLNFSARWQAEIGRTYRALRKELTETDEPLNVLLETRTSPSMIRTGKNAVRHFETLALISLLERFAASRPDDASDATTMTALLEEMSTCLKRLEQAEAARVPAQDKRRTRASRLRLHPEDWQDKLITGARPTLKLALLIFCLTGCRPCELERGMDFVIGGARSDVRLTIDLLGAKCDQHRGQPLRTFQFLAEDERPRLAELIDALRDYQSNTSSSTFRFSNAKCRIHERVCELWPHHTVRPSAYSFRYAFREQMALLGATRAEIARAMGHRSLASSLSYGHQKSRERSQDLVIDISATFEPRHQQRHVGDAHP